VTDFLTSILIVNYNGSAHLTACLDAIQNQTCTRHAFEVVVVDNASTDGSVGLIRSRFPWVRLISLERNVGFAEGTNVAARAAHGGNLVLVNNDTIPDPSWLQELVRAARSNPDGRAASKLVFAHDATQINSAGLFLLRDGRGADRGFRQTDCGQFEAGGAVFAGCGAALAMPAPSAGEPVLDPDYFLYYEDLDAGWRARLAGRSTRYAPRSLVRHVHGAAAGERSPLFHFHVERNRALTAWRNGDMALAAWSTAVLFAKPIRAVIGAVRSPGTWSVARAVARAGCSFLSRLPRAMVERVAIRSRPAVGTDRCGS
jgi:GT2 family glycosyltransferase